MTDTDAVEKTAAKTTSLFHIVWVASTKTRRHFFEARYDYDALIRLLRLLAKRSRVALHAYCLMSAEIQLLVHATRDDLEFFLVRMRDGYTRYLNNRLGRRDALFASQQSTTVSDRDEPRALRAMQDHPRELCLSFFREWCAEPRPKRGSRIKAH